MTNASDQSTPNARRRWRQRAGHRLRRLRTAAADQCKYRPSRGHTYPAAARAEELLDEPASPIPAEPRAIATAAYGPISGERFPVPAAPLSRINPAFLRARVAYASNDKPGTSSSTPAIAICTLSKRVAGQPAMALESARRIRLGGGGGHQEQAGMAGLVSAQGNARAAGRTFMKSMVGAAKRDWRCTGGPTNPLGARAMYLWQGNKDTYFRIHGTNEPWTIGLSQSSGCIRMINQDAMDLYARTSTGTNVVVLTTKTIARVG